MDAYYKILMVTRGRRIDQGESMTRLAPKEHETMGLIKLRLLLSLILALVIVVLGLQYPSSAGAAEMLDQSQTVSQSPTTIHSDTQQAQIFTAGAYGTLNRVSLRLENYTSSPPAGAALTVSVQTVIAGLPSGKQIGSGAIPLSVIPPLGDAGWVEVSIDGPVVTAGTQYALVLQTSQFGASVTWWYAYNTGYTGGTMAFNDGTSWRIDEAYDFTFETHVIPDTLDQYNHVENLGISGYALAQTFTAGLSGVIYRVRVYLQNSYATGSLVASIQTVKRGYP